MSITKSVYEGLMKIVVRVADVVELARRFEQSPKLAMVCRSRLASGEHSNLEYLKAMD